MLDLHQTSLAYLLMAISAAVGAVASASSEGTPDASAVATPPKFQEQAGTGLRPVSAFAGIQDDQLRSVAIFLEAGRVFQSPRCLNCHPAERMPTQGDDMHAHVPYMQAGSKNSGVPGLPCKTCHGVANAATLTAPIASIPGDPSWALAPALMAWQGKSLREICLQIKDPARNGGRSLDAIREHVAKDHLVGWAWRPGEGRRPAPGTQEGFSQLIRAWIETGAGCP